MELTWNKVAVDWDTMPEDSRVKLAQKGFTHLMGNEVAAKVTALKKAGNVSDTEAEESATQWRTEYTTRIMSGDMGTRAARATDPLAAAIKAVALPLAREHAKKTVGKLTKEYLASDAWKELVAKVCAKPIVVETAKANLAAANKIDLGDL